MPATFHPELKAAPRQDGTRAIRIRITKFRKHAYLNVGKYVLASQWNPKPSTKLHNYVLRHDDAPQYNNAIKNAISGLEQFADKLPAGSAADIKAAYENHLNPQPEEDPGKGLGYFPFADEYVTRAKSINYGTGKMYGLHVRAFKKIAGENTPDKEILSASTLHRFFQHLKGKGNGPKTIDNKFTTLLTIYNKGVKEGRVQDCGSPFESINITVPKKKKPRPSADKIKEFIAYEPKDEEERLAKLAAMMQYFLQGARIGEALTLKWETVYPGHIEYLPNKHALKPKFIPRSKVMNWLLEQLPKDRVYVLPFLKDADVNLPPEKLYNKIARFITQINKGLDKIAQALEIDIKLTSHMFRHAFADAVIATGSSTNIAAALLGHSNTRTTENYIKDLQLEDISDVSVSIFDKQAIPGETLGEQ